MLPCEIVDSNYLGGVSTYRVRLDQGAELRVALANTARVEIGAYAKGERLFAWFSADDSILLEP